MSRKPVNRLNPKSKGKVPAAEPATVAPAGVHLQTQEFARRLQAEMRKKGWSQSDLARHAFGKTTDARGFEVARNRDRVSVYLRGLQKPDPKNLELIAKALDLPAEELAGDLFKPTIANEQSEVLLKTVPGRADKTLLIVNKLVPLALAARVVTLLAEPDED